MREFLKLRTNWLKLALVLAMAVIVVRLFDVQIIRHQHYVDQANEQHMMYTTIMAQRGEIYMLDRGTPVQVAMNMKVWTVIVDPQTARLDREDVQKKITEYAGEYMIANWDDVFATTTLRYYVVARNVPYRVAQQIQDSELTGVWMQATTKRIYPEGALGSQLMGFVNGDGIGQYGVEGSLNADLGGKNGVLNTVKDVNNIPLTIGGQNVKVPAQDGKNIVLTIDRNIQTVTERALAQRTQEFGFRNATAIVMNPQTGEILAMAGVPTYDQGDFGNVEDASVYQLDATLGTYEPASVCKTFSMAAAIDAGKMTPETTYYNTDKTVVDGFTIENLSKGHTGNITMQTAYSWSLNTGSTQALRLLGGSDTEITPAGKKKLYEYYHDRFHLSEQTGVEIMESDGLMYEPDAAADVTYANMTFGQGFTATAIQVIAAFGALVNGGEYYAPTIVAGEMKDGVYYERDVAEPLNRAVSAETSATVRRMMRGARGSIPSILAADGKAYVGGKTGTAEMVDKETGSYTQKQTLGTYVGFGARSENDIPEYLILVKIWEEGKAAAGEYHARPIFNDISSYMIRYLQWDV